MRDNLKSLSARVWFFHITGIIIKCNGSGFQRTNEQPEGALCVVIRSLQRVGDNSLAFCPVLGTQHSLPELPTLEIFNGR